MSEFGAFFGSFSHCVHHDIKLKNDVRCPLTEPLTADIGTSVPCTVLHVQYLQQIAKKV